MEVLLFSSKLFPCFAFFGLVLQLLSQSWLNYCGMETSQEGAYEKNCDFFQRQKLPCCELSYMKEESKHLVMARLRERLN